MRRKIVVFPTSIHDLPVNQRLLVLVDRLFHPRVHRVGEVILLVLTLPEGGLIPHQALLAVEAVVVPLDPILIEGEVVVEIVDVMAAVVIEDHPLALLIPIVHTPDLLVVGVEGDDAILEVVILIVEGPLIGLTLLEVAGVAILHRIVPGHCILGILLDRHLRLCAEELWRIVEIPPAVVL